MVPLAQKLKVITYHFISYRRKSVVNLLVEIQNTFVFPAHRLFRPPKREIIWEFKIADLY